MIRVSFEISTPDLLQNTVKVTGESTVSFSCMLQCKINLVPAYCVPTIGDNKVTVGVGTVEDKELWPSQNLHYYNVTTP